MIIGLDSKGVSSTGLMLSGGSGQNLLFLWVRARPAAGQENWWATLNEKTMLPNYLRCSDGRILDKCEADSWHWKATVVSEVTLKWGSKGTETEWNNVGSAASMRTPLIPSLSIHRADYCRLSTSVFNNAKASMNSFIELIRARTLWGVAITPASEKAAVMLFVR